MRGSRLLIGLLVLATVLVDCAVVMAAVRVARFPDLILMLAWALQLSQVSLTAIWLAVGRTSSPLRLMVVVGVMAFWSWALALMPTAPELEEWAVLLMAQTAAVSVPLLVARWLGLGLAEFSSASQPEESMGGPERWQFSIAYLLGWMTVLAVMLSTLQCIAPDDRLPFGLVLKSSLAVFLAGRAVLASAALWAALGTGRPLMRVIALCAVVVAAASTLWLAQPGFAGGSYYLVALISLEGLLLLGALCVFRVAGYRLRLRRGR